MSDTKPPESLEVLAARLGSGSTEEGAAALRDLVRAEDRLVADNALKPYEDLVPKVVALLEPARAGALVEQLPVEEAQRTLFGSYTRVDDAVLRRLLPAMAPAAVAQLIDAMAVGVDPPREMARVLAGADDVGLSPGLALVHPAAALRLLREMEPDGQRQVVRLGGPAQAARIVGVLLAQDSSVSAAWAVRLLGGLEDAELREAESALTVPARARLEEARGSEPRADPSSHELRERLVELSDAPLDAAAALLLELHPLAAVRVLRPLGAARAAMLLGRLAEDDPQTAADLLAATSPPLLMRRPLVDTEPAWWLRECPAAAILEALDTERPAGRELVACLAPELGALFLEHVRPERAAALAALLTLEQESGLVLSLEALGVGRGRRTSRRLDHDLRWIHIVEELDTGTVVKPVVLDLLEIDLDRFSLSANMATSDATPLPADRTASIFEEYRASGRRPGAADFERFGLVQLSRAVEATGAVAAINGNFYFDYGHYINGVTLGVDIAGVPGLCFGDPIGWFVAEGEELIPPAFNRAAGVVTESGGFHIDRVFMTSMCVEGGARITWEGLNAPKRSGRVSAYTSLWGARTEGGDTHVDVAVGRGTVAAMSPTGAQMIPLTGFVVSIPREREDLLAGIAPGQAVRVENTFPPSRGRVLHAMACGPSLVRDGVLDTDFEAEDFGQQDSTVMSFFLPRTVETYEAARSFMAVRDRTLVLGTVSGTAYGFGRSTTSGGMTFGEMAQLCLDLGVDHAYALDGGGSSSLVAREDGRVRVLNTPTGGADVGAGEERYINTYWLVHEREGRT